MPNVASPAAPVTLMAEVSAVAVPNPKVSPAGRLHASRRVTVTYRQHWKAAETAIRSAAATQAVRGQGVSGDLAVYAFETLRLEYCDHHTGLLRTPKRRPLSERQMGVELALPRETIARVVVVLKASNVGGQPLLIHDSTGWVMRTAWMRVKPLHGDRSWLATDRPTWKALRAGVHAHDQAAGGGRLWHKTLGTLIPLRYRFALAESGTLITRHHRTYRELQDRDVCRAFGLEATAWQARKTLLIRSGVLGPVLSGLTFGIRHWDELEGLAGIVDAPGYTPPFLPPASPDEEQSEPDRSTSSETDPPAPAQPHPVDDGHSPTGGPAANSKEAVEPHPDAFPPGENPTTTPVDTLPNTPPVAHKSGLDTPGPAHKLRSPLERNHARVESCLLTTFASNGVQLPASPPPAVDNPAKTHAASRARRCLDTPDQAPTRHEHTAVNAMIRALCSTPELTNAQPAVRASFGIRTLLRRLHRTGYGPQEVTHYAFIDTPLPWPGSVADDPDQAVRMLAWRLRRLLTHRPSRSAAAAARDRESRPILEAIHLDHHRAAQRHARHERAVADYLALDYHERAAVCQMMRCELGSRWRGRTGPEPDDETAVRLIHRAEFAAAMNTAERFTGATSRLVRDESVRRAGNT